MSDFLSGIRHAVRTLRRAPGFAAVAVIILAIGIGASTVIRRAGAANPSEVLTA